MTHDVERVFADIDADHGDRCVEFLRHGVLLVLSAPCQLLVLAGPEHGRTIPLAEVGFCDPPVRRVARMRLRARLTTFDPLGGPTRRSLPSSAPHEALALTFRPGEGLLH